MPTVILIDTSVLSPLESAQLSAFYETFCAEGDEGALRLAAHAAFPVVVTEDLLYKIWLNFRHDEMGKPLNIPPVAVSDVLLSGLFREIGRNLFELTPGVRQALLAYLEGHERFGVMRVRRLAFFLRFYLRDNPEHIPSEAFRKAQEFVYEAELDPEKAARTLLDAWNRNDNARLQQLEELARTQRPASAAEKKEAAAANPLQVAVDLVRSIRSYQQGRINQEEAVDRIRDLRRAWREDAEEGIRVRMPEKLWEVVQMEETAPSAGIVKTYTKIHLLVHPRLDKQKLVQQLFGWNPTENRSLFVFPWESSLRDIPLIGEINFRVWVWDHQLPPELDRFILTDGGYYYLVMPIDNLLPQPKGMGEMLNRIYSQVGKVDITLLAFSSESQAEMRIPFFPIPQGVTTLLFVKPGDNFDAILHQEQEEGKGQLFHFVKLPENRPDIPEILAKKNQAGILRYEPSYAPFYKGFESFAPELHLNEMTEVVKKARTRLGLLGGSDLKEAQEFESYGLLQDMGLLYKSPDWSEAWLPLASGFGLEREFSFDGLPYSCLQFTFDFLPCDLGLRLLQWLANAGGILLKENSSVIYLHGVPVEIRIRESSRLLEVRIIHHLEKKALKDGSVLASVTDSLFELMNNFDSQLSFGHDKAKLIFEILRPWEENSPFRPIYTNYKKWAEGVLKDLPPQDPQKVHGYLGGARATLRATYDSLRKIATEKSKITQEEMAGIVAKGIWQMINGEDKELPEKLQEFSAPFSSVTFPTSRMQSYSYALQFETKILRIPAHATPDLVFIEGGTYPMGDVMDDKEYNDEKPVHDVTLSSFYLGRYAVTFDEYDAFCAATGREKPGDNGWGRARHPVINVNWYDAVEYCNWLSGCWGLTLVYKIDKSRQDPNNKNTDDKQKWLVTFDRNADGYRLPTEAEWEYAARQRGEKVRFGNGRDIADPKEINFNASESYKKPYSKVGEYRQKTVPVGSLNSPNSLGLHDMSGNVWEWCWDWFDSDFYEVCKKKGEVENPAGPDQGTNRVFRSGSWRGHAGDGRVAGRGSCGPARRAGNVGFRLARSL